MKLKNPCKTLNLLSIIGLILLFLKLLGVITYFGYFFIFCVIFWPVVIAGTGMACILILILFDNVLK